MIKSTSSKVHKRIEGCYLGGPASQRQLEVMDELGIIPDTDDITYGLAGLLIREAIEENKAFEEEYREEYPLPKPRFVKEATMGNTEIKTESCPVCWTPRKVNKPCFKCGSLSGLCAICGSDNYRYGDGPDVGLCDDCIETWTISPVLLVKKSSKGLSTIDGCCKICSKCKCLKILTSEDSKHLHLSGLALETIKKHEQKVRGFEKLFVGVCLSYKGVLSPILPPKKFKGDGSTFSWKDSKAFLGWINAEEL